MILHAADETQQDDVSNFQGGSFSLIARLFIQNLVVPDVISFQSSHILDYSQVYLVEGINQYDLLVSEFVELNGVSAVQTSETFITLTKISKVSGSNLVGNVTVSSSAEPITIGIFANSTDSKVGFEITELRGLLPRATGHPSLDKVFYDKFFIYNDTESTISFFVEEFIDDANNVEFALDLNPHNDTTSLNRLNRPANIDIGQFSNSTKEVANLGPGQSVGVWIQVRVSAGTLVPIDDYYIRLYIPILSGGFGGSGGFGRFGFGRFGFGRFGFGRFGSDDPSKLVLNDFQILAGISREPVTNALQTQRNSSPIGGGNPHQFIELVGGKFVPISFTEPDPHTFREKYYYNSRVNRLFKKIESAPKPVWKRIR